MLYQVAVLRKAKIKDDEVVRKQELVWMSDWIIADDADKAGMKAIMENRDSISIEFDDMEILVRPFL